MKHRLLLAFLLLPLLAQADAPAAAGLAEAFDIFAMVSLVFVVLIVALAFASLRRPHAPGLLKWYGGLLAMLAGACGVAALLQFFLKPLLALVAITLLLFVTTLARQGRTQ